MSKSIFILCLVCLPAFGFIQSEEKIQWLTDTQHDFGEIHHKKPAYFNFQFKNRYSEAVRIDNVRTSCGCTAPDWDESFVLPDSIGSIRIKYDAEKLGTFRKRIKVYFSGQRKAEKLYIEGEVIPK